MKMGSVIVEKEKKVLIMAEYIEREATVKLLRRLGSRDYRREKGSIQEAIKMVSFPEYTPSADVTPVRHGRWIASHDEFCACSICKYPVYAVWNQTNYCPNCGAKMDGGDGNSDIA